MKRSLLYLFAFISVQAIVTWIFAGLPVFAGNQAAMLITATAVYSTITLALFLCKGWSAATPGYLRKRQWGVFFWAAAAAAGTAIPSTWLQETFLDLPDNMEEVFSMIMSSDWGYLAICIFAPLAEEAVFRGAILRELLSSMDRRWYAIVISALLFSLIHANPAQMPHAFAIGIFLGWMFSRTGSILPGVLFHWMNNTIAFAVYRLTPQMHDMTLADLFNGDQVALGSSIALSLAVFALSLRQLDMRMEK